MQRTNLETILSFLTDESGATAIEYGLLAVLISVVIIGTVKLIGTNLNNMFNNVSSNLP